MTFPTLLSPYIVAEKYRYYIITSSGNRKYNVNVNLLTPSLLYHDAFCEAVAK